MTCQCPKDNGRNNVMMHWDSLRISRRSRASLAACVLGATIACSEPPDPRRTNFEITGKEGVAKYDPKTGRLSRIDIDQNKDGRIETFSYWDAARVLRIEIDSDRDGRIHRWEHYDEHNILTRVGSSRNDDGIEDTWAYPDRKGNLERVETDSDRDGVIDKRESFTAGAAASRVLSMVELDLDRSGNPGRRLVYGPDGAFRRVEVLR